MMGHERGWCKGHGHEGCQCGLRGAWGVNAGACECGHRQPGGCGG